MLENSHNCYRVVFGFEHFFSRSHLQTVKGREIEADFRFCGFLRRSQNLAIFGWAKTDGSAICGEGQGQLDYETYMYGCGIGFLHMYCHPPGLVKRFTLPTE